MKIYLASQSPRRRELLELMDVPFETLAIDTPEIVLAGEAPQDYSVRVTHEKLHAAWEKITDLHLQPMPVLCADTEVILDDVILGKPRDENDAFQMIKSYAGRTHEVLTSVGLTYYEYHKIETVKTFVTFSPISDEEIHHYLNSGNYKDKSGGYGIQSYIGQFICHIEGCFYSVMGLPLNQVRTMLNDLNSYLLEKNAM